MQIASFILKKPDKTRRTFQVIPYARVNGKKKYQKPILDESLSAINSEYLADRVSSAEALMHIKNVIIPSLKKKLKVPETVAIEAQISEHNLRVFKNYWTKEYRRKKLEEPMTARLEFLYALKILEPLSLLSADILDIQDHWDKKLVGNRHKKYGSRINQLLGSLNRSDKIILAKRVKPTIKFVTYDELQTILSHVGDPVLCDLYLALFATGCRLGEIFPLESRDLKDDMFIYIEKQVTSKLVHKPYTKNKINHDTLVIPKAKDGLKRWLKVKDKLQFRKCCQNPLIEASRKAFPDDRSKWISPHKLRHSYVRHLADSGFSLDEIKNYIGDTLKTTEDTYGGWIVSKRKHREAHQRLIDAENRL